MADIRIRRTHQLGQGRARELAETWAEDLKRDFQLECSFASAPKGDLVTFERKAMPQVNGTLLVAADHLDLHAKLSLLAAPFKETIQRTIEERLDELLDAADTRAEPPPNDSDETVRAVAKADRKTGAAAAVDPPQPKMPPEDPTLASKAPPKRAGTASKPAPTKAAATKKKSVAAAPKATSKAPGAKPTTRGRG